MSLTWETTDLLAAKAYERKAQNEAPIKHEAREHPIMLCPRSTVYNSSIGGTKR